MRGEAGKLLGLEGDMGVWLCGCLFKGEIKDTAVQTDGLDPVNFCSVMLGVKGFKGIPGSSWPCSCSQGKEFPVAKGMCLDSYITEGFGTGLQHSSRQNKSQTYSNISFITSTRRNTPLFYNLNIHKREKKNLLLLLQSLVSSICLLRATWRWGIISSGVLNSRW